VLQTWRRRLTNSPPNSLVQQDRTIIFIMELDVAESISYRGLTGYKYQLSAPYCLQINLRLDEPIESPYIRLSSDGMFTVMGSYAWDGPSGPTIDTMTFMRGSLVHDALYQLMRGRYLDYRIHRRLADGLLRQICLEDGMFPFRAWYVYWALRLLGGRNARPPERKTAGVITAP